jgi:hypothetical protein
MENKMKATIAKIIVRVIGTLIALLGLVMLCSMSFLLAYAPNDTIRGIWLLFSLVTLPMTLWFSYVGYLVWADFSPSVVRHVCGVFVFLCFLSVSSHTLEAARGGVPPSPWLLPAFFGLLIAACAVHRLISKQLNHWLFPEFG